MDVHTTRQPRAFDQFNSPTHDNSPDENRGDNCSEGATCSVLDLYGIRRPDGSLYQPDDLKDWAFGQNAVGDVGTTTTISNMAAHFAGLATITYVPADLQNGHTGLLDRYWQSLHDRAAPTWTAVWWIDAAGNIYDGAHRDAQGNWLPAVGHWREVWRLTNALVYTMDPSGGTYREEGWDAHWAMSRKVTTLPLVGPNA